MSQVEPQQGNGKSPNTVPSHMFQMFFDERHRDNLPYLASLEREYITYVLKYRFDGNKSRAAKALGLDRRTLYRKLLKASKEK